MDNEGIDSRHQAMKKLKNAGADGLPAKLVFKYERQELASYANTPTGV